MDAFAVDSEVLRRDVLEQRKDGHDAQLEFDNKVPPWSVGSMENGIK